LNTLDEAIKKCGDLEIENADLMTSINGYKNQIRIMGFGHRCDELGWNFLANNLIKAENSLEAEKRTVKRLQGDINGLAQKLKQNEEEEKSKENQNSAKPKT